MDQDQQSRWQPTRRQLLWAGGIAALAFLGIVVCGYLFGWKWTGLPKKTLWDWLSLLIVPAVLALGGYFFTRSENRRTREDADQQRSLDREIADERRQDDMLQAYLDGMSQLLTDKERPLHRAELGDYLSTMARARTTTVLQRLKGERKGSVVKFLYESGLVAGERPVLGLNGVDLRGANLRGSSLYGAYLGDVVMSNADLKEADLREADLNHANLIEANLEWADLSHANLEWADLKEADLSHLNLTEANLQHAKLSGATLTTADLSRAHLAGTNLLGADLREALLMGADLSRAHLAEANLRDAILMGADLSGTILEGADLSGTILVDTTGATEGQLIAAKALEGATMPNGQEYEDWLKDRESRKEDGENE